MEIVARKYAQSMSLEYFRAIEDRDTEAETYDETLGARLGSLEGVSEVDYNGHFGAFIYFTLDSHLDTSEKREDIYFLILKYAQGRDDF